jgi:AraC-like DNA-binding protein
MHVGAATGKRIAPSVRGAAAITALSTFVCDSDGVRVALPRPEVQLVVRFGPASPRGLDVHAMGVRQRAHRKLIRSGQQAVTAQLRLAAIEAVLGVPASAIAGRVIALEELWGDAATGRLLEQLASAPDLARAAAILDRAIAERLGQAARLGARDALASDAAERLMSASVNAVADELGVSARHLRRVFRQTVGVSPKTFAKLARFRRALVAAREGQAGWASIAAGAGYYDQAHLIAEFRAIAGVTPGALLQELSAAPSLD